jgi:hypothetical protein
VLNFSPQALRRRRRLSRALRPPPFKAAAAEDFGLVTAKISKPSANEVIDRGAFSYDYDVGGHLVQRLLEAGHRPLPHLRRRKAAAHHGSRNPLSTTIIPYKGVAYTGTVKLGPGEQVVVPLEIDLKSEGFMVSGVVGITMTVQKISSAGQVFDADRKSFIVK